MEFLRIGDAKIKIVLTGSELAGYGISASDDGCSAKNRRAVWEILEEAKREVGFDPEGDKILVQFYPMRDGGCEMFVTKLGILPPSSARFVSRSERVTLISRAQRYFMFPSLFDIARAIRAIYSSELEERCATVLSGENTYVLVIDEIGDGGDGELAVLREFSRPVSEELYVYALEHFDTIYENTPIKTLADI
ncbi:MAG: adaptor protein MecA [Clostridia bacterium]|nr:adaptor protein MecA [Clostridia bacterium]